MTMMIVVHQNEREGVESARTKFCISVLNILRYTWRVKQAEIKNASVDVNDAVAVIISWRLAAVRADAVSQWCSRAVYGR